MLQTNSLVQLQFVQWVPRRVLSQILAMFIMSYLGPLRMLYRCLPWVSISELSVSQHVVRHGYCDFATEKSCIYRGLCLPVLGSFLMQKYYASYSAKHEIFGSPLHTRNTSFLESLIGAQAHQVLFLPRILSQQRIKTPPPVEWQQKHLQPTGVCNQELYCSQRSGLLSLSFPALQTVTTTNISAIYQSVAEYCVKFR